MLRTVAATLAGRLRSGDLAARYGGEEFVILLPETEAEEAEAVAERLRSALEAAGWPDRPITASLGVATSDGGEPDPWDLVRRADAALDASKRLGRNRVTRHLGLEATRPSPLDPECQDGPDGPLALSGKPLSGPAG